MICTMATTMVLSSLNVKVLAVGNSINETNIEEATRVSYYSFDDSNADDAWGNRRILWYQELLKFGKMILGQ